MNGPKYMSSGPRRLERWVKQAARLEGTRARRAVGKATLLVVRSGANRGELYRSDELNDWLEGGPAAVSSTGPGVIPDT